VDLGDTPADIGACNPMGGQQYFMDMIWPNYLHTSGAKDCAQSSGCHLMAHGLALSTSQPIDYASNFKIAQQYLVCGTPEASELLTKPLAGIDLHGGGDLFTMSDMQYSVFLDWFK